MFPSLGRIPYPRIRAVSAGIEAARKSARKRRHGSSDPAACKFPPGCLASKAVTPIHLREYPPPPAFSLSGHVPPDGRNSYGCRNWCRRDRPGSVSRRQSATDPSAWRSSQHAAAVSGDPRISRGSGRPLRRRPRNSRLRYQALWPLRFLLARNRTPPPSRARHWEVLPPRFRASRHALPQPSAELDRPKERARNPRFGRPPKPLVGPSAQHRLPDGLRAKRDRPARSARSGPA